MIKTVEDLSKLIEVLKTAKIEKFKMADLELTFSPAALTFDAPETLSPEDRAEQIRAEYEEIMNWSAR